MKKILKTTFILLLTLVIYLNSTKSAQAQYNCSKNISVFDITETSGKVKFDNISTLVPTASHPEFKTWAYCGNPRTYILHNQCLDLKAVSRIRTATWGVCFDEEVHVVVARAKNCKAGITLSVICEITFKPEDNVGRCVCPIEPFKPTECKGGGVKYPKIRTALGCIETHPGGFLVSIWSFLFNIGGGIAFLLMIIGSFFILTSQGQPERVKRGKEIFVGAIAGLFVMIAASFLMQLIGVDILGLFKPK
jgi:hypothetical protein